MKVLDEINESYQVHHFYNEDDYELTPPRVYEYQFYYAGGDSFWDPSLEPGSQSRLVYEYPFITHSLESYMNGLSKQVDIYDENNSLVKSSSYDYEEVYSSSVFKNYAFTLRYKWTDGNAPESWHYWVSEYNIKPKFIRLNSQIDRYYENGISNLTSEITINYKYHNTYPSLPKEIETLKTDGSGESYNKKSLFQYP